MSRLRKLGWAVFAERHRGVPDTRITKRIRDFPTSLFSPVILPYFLIKRIDLFQITSDAG